MAGRVVRNWREISPARSSRASSAGSTRVEIELQREGNGTRLRLTHSDVKGEGRDAHEKGGARYLLRIKTVSEGGNPGPDPLADPTVRRG